MILSVTGPRQILGLNDWNYKSKLSTWIYSRTIQEMKKLDVQEVWNGAAVGYDQIAATACLNLGIPLILCIPFEGHDKGWPDYNRKLHQNLIRRASKVNIVGKSYDNGIYQRRNEHIVNMSTHLLACYDGITPGGTKNCHDYAVKERKQIIILDPKDFSRRTVEGKNKVKNTCRNCDAGTPHRNCL